MNLKLRVVLSVALASSHERENPCLRLTPNVTPQISDFQLGAILTPPTHLTGGDIQQCLDIFGGHNWGSRIADI